MALDHRRGHTRRLAREDQAAVPDLTPSHEQSVLAAERSRRLWEAIDALPERLRLVIVLASIEEHSVRDVAAIVDAPEGTVKSRLFEARQKLQELLR
jgi:RNA polymerase sigma-70 factor (ECF subfamily)